MSTQGWGGTDPWQQAIQDVQASYRNARVTYTVPDERADDSVTANQVRPHAIRSLIVLLVAFPVALVVACCGCFGAMLDASEVSESLEGSSDAFDSAQASVITAMVVFGLAFLVWIASLFFPLKEPIAEYSLLVEGRSAAAPAAYGYILQSAHLRGTPFGVGAVRIAGQYLLSLGDRRVQSLIAVQVYGGDLYFGWTMWRSRSTIVLIGHALRDAFRLVAGGGTTYRSAILGGRVRALREITHSITRLGVQAAIMNMMATADTLRMIEQIPQQEVPPGITPPAVAPPPIQSAQTSGGPTTGSWPQPQGPQPQAPQPTSGPPSSGAPYGGPSGGPQPHLPPDPPPHQPSGP